MTKSIASGEYRTMSEAAKLIPGHPHVNTVKRWTSKGYAGVVLQSWKCGQRRMTTVSAIDEFIALTTKAEDPNPRQSVSHTEAERALDAMGVS